MAQAGVVAGSSVLTDWISLGVLASSVPRDVVDDAVEAAGKGARRAGGKLPPHVMVYFVMALALFADDDYEEVAARLAETLRGWGGWERDWEVPTSGGITQARQRLGPEPMAEVFGQVAVPVADLDTAGAFLGGWRLMSVDGMEWDVPDTAANRAFFGSRGGPAGPAPFPKARVVTVSECGSHAAVAAAMGPAAGGKGSGEQALARRLYPRPGGGLAAARGPELLLLHGLVRRGRDRGGAAVAGPVQRGAAGAGGAAGRVLALGAGQPAGRSAVSGAEPV